MHNSFAIIHTWPEIKNAEYEVLQRVIAAAALVNRKIVVIDNSGIVLWSDPDLALEAGERMPNGAVDFILSLHFESPRVLDEYSYYALWQPLDFYHDFGYQKSIDQLSTHHDLISCASDIADAHALNIYGALKRAPLLPLSKMFHSLPEPFLEPNVTEASRLFYIGINWERIGRPRGRFHEALIFLDSKDLVDIYGPEKMLGVAPWEGFDSYAGELPFDGKSVKSAINRSGICLALSSGPHKASGIMSNRLFEGFAGGAAVIATPNPLINKYFADCVYLVDDTRGEVALAQQILELMREIRANPEEAIRRVRRGQQIIRESCSLEASITALFTDHAMRVAHFEQTFLAPADATAILIFDHGTLDQLAKQIRQFKAQKRASIDLHVLCDLHLVRAIEEKGLGEADDALRSLKFHPVEFAGFSASFEGSPVERQPTGPIVRSILSGVKTELFGFFGAGEEIFSDHFASIAKALHDTPGAMAGCSGRIAETLESSGRMKRTLDGIRFTDFDSIVLVNGDRDQGRFLYDSALLRGGFSALLMILDMEEHRYFRLAAYLLGPLAQTNYASYVLDHGIAGAGRAPVMPRETQQQYIRDRFVRDARWLEKLAKGTKIPEFVFAYGPGAPVRWNDYRPPHSVTVRLKVEQTYPIRSGGSGMLYLVAGFSLPEAEHVWLAASCGVVEFSLAPEITTTIEDYELVFQVSGRRSWETGRSQHCTVAINGMVVAYAAVQDTMSALRIRIPKNFLRDTSLFRVEITPDHADVVYDQNGVILDSRRLSIQFKSIGVFRATGSDLPIFSVGTSYSCGAGAAGTAALATGFHGAEGNFTWLAGTTGTVRFAVDHVPAEPRLRLKLIGRRSLASKEEQRVMLTLNGVDLKQREIDDQPKYYSFDLSADDIRSGVVNLSITATHAEAVFDSAHNVIDSRLLGVAIAEIGLFDRRNPVKAGWLARAYRATMRTLK